MKMLIKKRYILILFIFSTQFLSAVTINISRLDLGRPEDVASAIQNIISKRKIQRQDVTGLCLRGCGLTEFPMVVLNLPNLEVLDLSWNRISSISPQIRQMQNLRSLRLRHCGLRKCPMGVLNLPNLEVLDLSWNRISSISPQIRRMQKLSNLSVVHNNFLISGSWIVKAVFFCALENTFSRAQEVISVLEKYGVLREYEESISQEQEMQEVPTREREDVESSDQ